MSFARPELLSGLVVEERHFRVRIAISGLGTQDLPEEVPEEVPPEYSGRLLRVKNWTGDLTYHPSGTWATIPHLNGTQDDHNVKSNNNSRTDSLHTTNPGVLWNTGTYMYDGWGDIHQIGNAPDNDWYRYDEANRLVRASVQDPSGQRTQQDYTYDTFGNITQIKTWPPGQSSQTITIQVNANTNRLSSAGYDASGNMILWGSDSYTYDTGNQMVKQNGRWYFLYTFSGERIATIDWQGSIATREVDWTIRGPSNQVLSMFKLTGEDQAGNWSREIDYIWMGRRLLGTEDGSGTKQHYHTDHLGTIRLITDSAGNKVSEHEYMPYGQELTAAGNGVMKFTGHERDGDTGMDYMHARFYQEHLGRFMGTDSILGDIGGAGGSWNRYQYGLGNPMKMLDPDGLDDICWEDIEDGVVVASGCTVTADDDYDDWVTVTTSDPDSDGMSKGFGNALDSHLNLIEDALCNPLDDIFCDTTTSWPSRSIPQGLLQEAMEHLEQAQREACTTGTLLDCPEFLEELTELPDIEVHTTYATCTAALGAANGLWTYASIRKDTGKLTPNAGLVLGVVKRSYAIRAICTKAATLGAS